MGRITRRAAASCCCRHVQCLLRLPVCMCTRTAANEDVHMHCHSDQMGCAAAYRSMMEQSVVEKYFQDAGNWGLHENITYWIGANTQKGIVYINSQAYASWSSMASPYTHFVHYENVTTQMCVVASPRYAYIMYKTW
jgi:hypothetical protein